MKFRLYQLKDIKSCDYAFMSWNFAKRHNFTMEDYKRVYTGCVDGETDIQALEKLYEIFNTNRPSDFKGHSISISDVVVLRNKVYYGEIVPNCDNIGWKDITYVANVRNQMSEEEMIEYLLEELEEERRKMLMGKENKYGYLFMLCNDMGIVKLEQ